MTDEQPPVASLFDPDLTPVVEQEPSPIQKRILELNRANNDIVVRLKQMAGVEPDPTGQRFEMFTEMLVDMGIVPAEAMEEFNLRWVEFYNNFLVQTEVRIRGQIEAQIEHARRAQAQAKLGVPQSPGGLVVPGHVGRANGSGRRGKRG